MKGILIIISIAFLDVLKWVLSSNVPIFNNVPMMSLFFDNVDLIVGTQTKLLSILIDSILTLWRLWLMSS